MLDTTILLHKAFIVNTKSVKLIKKEGLKSVLLNHLNFQEVKINLLNKTVLVKASLVMPLEILHIRVKPYRLL
jgi:hypothetical protein